MLDCIVKRILGNHYEVHVVAPGDTLSGISQKRFHTPARWGDIAALNNLKRPYTIYPGQVIKLPRKGP